MLISINNFRDREEDARHRETHARREIRSEGGGGGHLAGNRAGRPSAGLAGCCSGIRRCCMASFPVLFTGMRIIWGVLTFPPGPAFNRLLALGGVQLILFAAVFHLAAAFS